MELTSEQRVILELTAAPDGMGYIGIPDWAIVWHSADLNANKLILCWLVEQGLVSVDKYQLCAATDHGFAILAGDAS